MSDELKTFSKEELLDLFSVYDLQLLYKTYVDSDPAVQITSKDTLANLLKRIVPKQLGLTFSYTIGDLVLDCYTHELVRILKLDYVDDRYGKFTLVYGVEEGAKYVCTSPLAKVAEISFSENVAYNLRTELVLKAKSNNFVIINNEKFRLGSLYVIDDNMARYIIKVGQFTYSNVVIDTSEEE